MRMSENVSSLCSLGQIFISFYLCCGFVNFFVLTYFHIKILPHDKPDYKISSNNFLSSLNLIVLQCDLPFTHDFLSPLSLCTSF